MAPQRHSEAPRSAGCWEEGLEAEDGSGGSWTQSPSGEGFARLLLVTLTAESARLTHNFDQNYTERRSVLRVSGLHVTEETEGHFVL